MHRYSEKGKLGCRLLDTSTSEAGRTPFSASRHRRSKRAETTILMLGWRLSSAGYLFETLSETIFGEGFKSYMPSSTIMVT